MRADLCLSKSHDISRNKAINLIKEGRVKFDGVLIKKPSQEIDENADIEVFGDIFVGRGAIKLKGFLDGISLDLKAKSALDIGSSTGGFAQILLKYGAKEVTCVDVGKMQLASELLEDARVRVYEGIDIREFDGGKFDIVTCDVSFIEVEKILPQIDKFAAKFIIILFKPQFEVGIYAKRNSKGVLKDTKAVSLARKRFECETAKFGWVLKKSEICTICGKEGNEEFFYLFEKSVKS